MSGGFRVLAKALHLAPDQGVLMLSLPVDDSGGDAVGGCVASEQEWERLEPEWAKALADFHVAWFHAVDFEKPGDQSQLFAHLSATERDNLMRRLLSVLREALTGPCVAYVCAISPPEILAMLTRLQRQAKEKRPPQRRGDRQAHWVRRVGRLTWDTYCHDLSHCLGLAARNVARPHSESMHVFVSDQPKRRGDIPDIYAGFLDDPLMHPYFGGLSHGERMNPRALIPLQIADLAAYYLSRAAREPGNSRAWIADALQPQFVEETTGFLTGGWIERPEDE